MFFVLLAIALKGIFEDEEDKDKLSYVTWKLFEKSAADMFILKSIKSSVEMEALPLSFTLNFVTDVGGEILNGEFTNAGFRFGRNIGVIKSFMPDKLESAEVQ